VGLLLMAIGVFLASWPFLGIVFFLKDGSAPKGEMLLFAVLGPLVLMGPICFPLGGYLLFAGLLLSAGHTEVAVRAARLHLIERCGLLRWTRRRPLVELRGFRVEHEDASLPDGTRAMGQPGEWATLKADLANGKSVTVCQFYPREWLLPLAEDLARRCLQVVARGATAVAEPLPVTEDVIDSALIQDRPRQPANSTAILEPQPDGLTITIPPAGLLRGSHWVFVVWCLGWNSFLVPAPLFLIAAFRGEMKGTDESLSVLFVCLFFSPFLLIGIGSLLALLHRGWRRTSIAVAGGSLQVVESGLFGTRRHRWAATDLLDVRAISELREDGEGTSWAVALEVQPKEGATYRLLPYRDKAELEWIATVVRQALRLRPAATQPAPVPAGHGTATGESERD
jgi:hypothetical protein